MGKRQFLLRRGNTLYYRRKFPVAVQKALNRKEFKRALGTGDRVSAEGAIIAANIEYARIVDSVLQPIQTLRKGPQKAAVLPKADYPTPYPRKLSELSAEELYEIVERWYAGSMLELPARAEGPEEAREAEKALRADSAELAKGNYRQLSANLMPRVDQLLIQSGLIPDRKHPRYAEALQLMARGYAARAEFEAAFFAGDDAPIPSDRLFAGIVAQGLSVTPRRRQEGQRTFGMLLDEYLRHRATMNLGSRTQRDEKSISRLLRDLVGNNTRIAGIDFQVCQAAKERLMQLPPKCRDKYPNIPLADIPARARTDGLAPMSKKTANKYIDFMSAAFEHGRLRLRWVSENPAEGLRFKLKKSDTEKYRPFTIEQLNKIFSAPLYTGCANADRGYDKPGNCMPRESGRYWVPLIALFTGMRLNEICQLDTADIGKIEGVDVIHVREESETSRAGENNKRLKTEAANRTIPVHPELKRLGLLALVEKRRKRDERKLFPDLRIGGDQYYSDAFQKWFSRFLGKIGVKDRRISFHSFRHTFRDATRRAKIDVEIVNALAGWTANSMAERYGQAGQVMKLVKEVGKVKYTDLALRHLYRD